VNARPPLVATLLPILGITFIDILGFSILIPILPYYVQHFGAPYVVVGLLFASFALCQFVAGPLWGNLSDRIGRKAVLIISQIGATIGWTMLAFAPTLPWVFAARMIEGFSGGNISVTQAYVADRVAPQERSRAFAYIGAAFSAGLVFGPLAGGTLLSAYGYRVPFLLAAGLQVLTLIVTIAFLPEHVAAKADRSSAATFSDIVRFLRDRRVSRLLLQKLTFSLGLYAWFAAFALVLHILLGFGAAETSYFFAAFGVLSIAIQLGLVGRLADRLGVRTASNLGFAAAVIFFLSIPFVHSAGALLGVTAIFAFALSLTNATLPALLTDASPDEVRGTILGVGSSLESVAGVAMPTVSTAVLAAFGPPWTGAISAFFCCIALALGLAAGGRTESARPISNEAA
jgi:multidrug resistance protein